MQVNRNVCALRGRRHFSFPLAPRTLVRAVVLMALMVMGAGAGCSRGVSGAMAPTVSLVVDNRGYFDVNVYVVRTPGSRGRRVGNVVGGATEFFRIRESELQAGGQLVLQVRAIAGRSAWTSPSVSVNVGAVARLDVYSSPSGDLASSQFYLQ